MTKIIYNKFDKTKIGQLPVVCYEGKIVVVLSEREAEQAVDYLLSCDILGIDTETRPTFRKGRMHDVALLQVSSREVCFLFRLNLLGIPPCILRLLEDTRVPKIGLSLADDMLMLHRRAPFTPGKFIDLQMVVKELGIEDQSLQKIYANIFGERIVKRQQLSNWEADVLNDKQKHYAATDAWTCIKLYEEIERLTSSGDYRLVVVPSNQNDNDIQENLS